jgi:hypothetical protein
MSCVYVISEGKQGPVKVGVANNPNTRVRELQSGNPKRLSLANWWKMPDRATAFSVEKEILGEMARYRLMGEWIDADEFGMCALVETRIEERFCL